MCAVLAAGVRVISNNRLAGGFATHEQPCMPDVMPHGNLCYPRKVFGGGEETWLHGKSVPDICHHWRMYVAVLSYPRGGVGLTRALTFL